ncbi:hypothetical protein OAY19_03135 [Acidimicrobiaceae bacterium]|nr:hypothetical protein [Acidimicrobiaceae bacterium]
MKKFLAISFIFLFINSHALAIPNDSSSFTDDHEQIPVPAIVIEEEVEVPEDPQWTYKFLIPTSVAIATLVIIGNIVQYFRQVTKKRYKVIKK